MKFGFGVLSLAVASVLLCAAPSHATTVYATYEGTVLGTYNSIVGNLNYDPTGLFGGRQSGNLAGQHYTASYIFNVVFPPSNSNYGGDGTGNSAINFIYGGSYYGNVSPAQGANFTIGATTVMVVGDGVGYIYGENDGGASGSTEQYHEADDTGLSRVLYNYIINSKGTSGLPSALALSAYNYNVGSGDNVNGIFCTDNFTNCIVLVPTALHITTDPPGQTPLPPALPLFASGLGAMGLFAWRRKRKDVTISTVA